MQTITSQAIAAMIDHAVLTPTSTDSDVEAACRLCVKYRTAGIFVRPSDVAAAAGLLADSSVKVGTVIGFPHGTTSTAAKTAEAEQAALDGCHEIDMVLNIGRLLSGNLIYVESDIAAVTAVARRAGLLIKVILEAYYLDQAQKKIACAICSDLGVDFVKTSTGFAGGGATVADVHLMRTHCPESVAVGIRRHSDLDAAAHQHCGATRIGILNGKNIRTTAQQRGAGRSVRPMTLAEALRHSERRKGCTNRWQR